MGRKKPLKTCQITVRFTPGEYQRLKAVSLRADVSSAALIRRLLNEAIPVWEKQLDKDRLSLL